MLNIYLSSFHWNLSRINATEEQVKAACLIINAMTDVQKEAVELYARSRYEDGEDSGLGND